MVDNKNKEFDKVYDKLLAIIDSKLKYVVQLRELGMGINVDSIKLLNLYIRYLEDVKQSKYSYFTVSGLTNISNYLNKI